MFQRFLQEVLFFILNKRQKAVTYKQLKGTIKLFICLKRYKIFNIYLQSFLTKHKNQVTLATLPYHALLVVFYGLCQGMVLLGTKKRQLYRPSLGQKNERALVMAACKSGPVL